MRLGSKLRQAEEHGAKAARLGAERVKAGIHSVEAGLHKLNDRRKAKNAKPVSAHVDPEQETRAPNPKVRTGIVSVNGQDVEKVRCTGH